MRFALVDGHRREAEPNLTGECPGCRGLVVAKCGEVRMHHWAHRGLPTCDSWWEPETQWHRAWKDHFPKQWQEHHHCSPGRAIQRLGGKQGPRVLRFLEQHPHVAFTSQRPYLAIRHSHFVARDSSNFTARPPTAMLTIFEPHAHNFSQSVARALTRPRRPPPGGYRRHFRL